MDIGHVWSNFAAWDQAILHNPIVVDLGASVAEALEALSSGYSTCVVSQESPTPSTVPLAHSCVLVVDQEKLVGICTERDIVRAAAQGDLSLDSPVDQLMTRQVFKLQQSELKDLLSVLNLFRQHHVRHLPIVDDAQRPTGLLTYATLSQLLQPTDLLRLRQVADAMATTVIQASPGVSVRTVAQLMAEHQVSTVVITEKTVDTKVTLAHGGQSGKVIPKGIITERDLVQFKALGLDLDKVLAHTIMSTNLLTVSPEVSLWHAKEVMQQRYVGRVVVVGPEGELLGIVTQSTLLQVIDPLELYNLVRILGTQVAKLKQENLSLLQRQNTQLSDDLTARTAALELQIRRTTLVKELAELIHSTFDLNTILAQAMDKIRRFLECDRTLVFQFYPDYSGYISAESVEPGFRPVLGDEIADPCFQANAKEAYGTGFSCVVENITQAGYPDCYIEMLQQYQVKANLVVPILSNKHLWGLLIAHHCSQPYQWQPEHVTLLQELAVQIAIAVDKVRLYQKAQAELEERCRVESEQRQTAQALQQLNQQLEQRIAERTEDLRRSEERWQLAAEASQEGIWDCNLITGEVFLSPRCRTLLGVDSSTELIDVDDWVKIIHPDDRERVQSCMQQHLEQKQPFFECEYRLRYYNGEVIWVEDRGQVHLNKSGQPYRVVGSMVDISRRKVVEKQLRDSELLYRSLFEGASDAIILTDCQGHFIQANQWAIDLLGYAHEELIKMAIQDIYPPEVFESLSNDKKVPRFGQSTTIETIILAKDGHQIPVEISKTLIDMGEEILVQGIIRDIRDRKKADLEAASLMADLSNFKYALDQSCIVAITDIEGRITYVNDQFCILSGYSRQDLIGHSHKIIKSTYHSPQFFQNLWATILDGQVWRGEICNKARDGVLFWVDMTIVPFLDNQGNPYQFLAISTDITDLKETEIALRESHRTASRQLSAIEAAIDGIAIADDNQKFIYLNHAHVEMFGYQSAEELIGKTWEVLYSPEEATRLRQELPSLRAQGGFQGEAIALRKDGSTFAESLSLTMTNNGYLICVCQDITQQKQAQTALVVSEARYRRIVETAGEGIWVIDADNHTTFANAQIATMLKTTPVAMSGRSLFDFVDQEMQAQIALYFGPNNQRLEQHDVKFRCSDGSLLWAIIAATPILDEDQRYQGALIMLTDITERKQIESALVQENQFRKQIVDAMAEGLCVCRVLPEFPFLEFSVWNHRMTELTGYTMADINKLGWFESIFPDPDLLKNAISRVEMIHQGTHMSQEEWLITRSDGQERWLAFSTSTLNTNDNSPQILALIQDFTERKQLLEALSTSNKTLQKLNADLERATQLKDEFLANMSHELRTPLNAILGMAEGLSSDVFGPITCQQNEAVHTIETSAFHLLDLVNDILDLAKIRAGKFVLKLDYISVSYLCESSLQIIRQSAVQKGIHLECDIPPDIPDIKVDVRRIRQVLINLLSNAIKFSPDQSEVKIKVSYEQADAQSYLVISVIDQGIGISSQEQKMLFQPFTQLQQGLSRSHRGTGLGLSLASQLVKQHGGSITVTSQIGQGSCFTVYLPYGTSLPSPRSTLSSSKGDDNFLEESNIRFSSNKEKSAEQTLVLLVEDDEANMASLSSYLKSRNFSLTHAVSDKACLELVKQQIPDIILMDIQIPEMGGIEAIRQLRNDSDPAIAQIPIIALTALSTSGDRDRCLEAGANDYFSKPLKLKNVLAAIKQLT